MIFTQNLRSVITIHLLVLGSSFCFLGCQDRSVLNHVQFSTIEEVYVEGYHPLVKEYCTNYDQLSNEHKAVLASFIGEYETSLKYAEKNSSKTQFQEIDIDEKALESLLEQSTTEDKEVIKNLLEIVKRPKELEELFSKYSPIPAVDHIISEARNHDFLLLNEAHYSGQHRALTEKLLQPLWDQGFRYLALETLGYTDSTLAERKYPEITTGYYTKEVTFGNLLRNAISIGYEIIPYESKLKGGGTFRDSIQARNILDQTFKKKSKGKVLVHAGYSHINEYGDKQFEPMGSQLKKISKRKILSVEQQVMTGFSRESNKTNAYFEYVTSKYKIKEPSIFIDKKRNVLIDPINQMGVDIQVYNPIVTFPNHRPDWLQTEDKFVIRIPKEYSTYEGHLIQAFYRNESLKAIPLDQFIVSSKKNALVLGSGLYEIRIIDCNGNWIAKGNIEINMQ